MSTVGQLVPRLRPTDHAPNFLFDVRPKKTGVIIAHSEAVVATVTCDTNIDRVRCLMTTVPNNSYRGR